MWFDPERALAAMEGAERAPSQPREEESSAGAAPCVAHVAHVARTQPQRRATRPCISDPEMLLGLLQRDGPMTYGAAAVALGWGATRGWQAEAQLTANGLVRTGSLGKLMSLGVDDDV